MGEQGQDGAWCIAWVLFLQMAAPLERGDRGAPPRPSVGAGTGQGATPNSTVRAPAIPWPGQPAQSLQLPYIYPTVCPFHGVAYRHPCPLPRLAFPLRCPAPLVAGCPRET